MASLLLSIVGPDRPGLVRSLSAVVVAHGGSWLESRLARLGGQFAGIVIVEAPEALLADLSALETAGLRITATALGAGAARPVAGPRLMLEVVGNDRPGIVRETTEVLAACSVNIEEMTTEITSGAFDGQALFRATIVIRAANDAVVEKVSANLEQLSNEMMVDIRPLEG